MRVKVAIPIWNGRVSPVMDTAQRLLISEIVDDREISRTIVDIPQTNISHIARFIAEFAIDDLICAAISHQFEQILSASGIKVKPWFQGEVDRIVAAYSGGDLQNDIFFSPGRGRRRRRGGGGWRRAGRANCDRSDLYKEDR
jgi:predicted Fe-Mo cluster-binding NifX family protein